MVSSVNLSAKKNEKHRVIIEKIGNVQEWLKQERGISVSASDALLHVLIAFEAQRNK